MGSLLVFHEAIGPAEAYVILHPPSPFGWFVSTQDVRVGKLEVLMDLDLDLGEGDTFDCFRFISETLPVILKSCSSSALNPPRFKP